MATGRMRKTICYLYGLLLIFALGCSESDLDNSSGNHDTLYVVTIVGDSVILNTGSVSSIDFSITPNDSSIVFNNDSANYIIELRLGDNTVPENYKIKGIDNIEGNSSVGIYRAYIEDLCLKNNYDDKVKLVLKDKTKGTSFESSTFCVKYNRDSQTKTLLELGLPLVILNTVNNEEPTCDYVAAPYGLAGAGIKNASKVPGQLIIMKDSNILYNSGSFEKDKSGMTLKIRGNTSAYGEKKPYKIKLEKKADLLFRNNDDIFKDKDWLLLKYDNLKTMVGFKLNELMMMQWTPQCQFVNVVLNGDYRGLYLITESVKRNTNCRIDVDKTGFIIEYDPYWWNEEVCFVSDWSYSLDYTFKYPDEDDVTAEQIDYIKQCIDTLETCILEGGKYEEYLDVDSWARWILAHDILGTLDVFGSNIFITKFDNTDGSKLKMANMWDFDSVFYMSDTWANSHASYSLYFEKLFKSNNTIFKDTYKSLWNIVNPSIFNEMNTFLSSFEKSEIADCINRSIILDNKRWGTSDYSVSAVIKKSKSWFESRQVYLNNAIPNL